MNTEIFNQLNDFIENSELPLVAVTYDSSTDTLDLRFDNADTTQDKGRVSYLLLGIFLAFLGLQFARGLSRYRAPKKMPSTKYRRYSRPSRLRYGKIRNTPSAWRE